MSRSRFDAWVGAAAISLLGCSSSVAIPAGEDDSPPYGSETIDDRYDAVAYTWAQLADYPFYPQNAWSSAASKAMPEPDDIFVFGSNHEKTCDNFLDPVCEGFDFALRLSADEQEVGVHQITSQSWSNFKGVGKPHPDGTCYGFGIEVGFPNSRIDVLHSNSQSLRIDIDAGSANAGGYSANGQYAVKRCP